MFSRKVERVGKLFGNLKVRPKLMVLHNLFFLVLTTTAYFTLIPLYEQLVTDAGVHPIVLEHPGPSAQAARQSQRWALTQAKVRLFLVLGILYLLAVILLESVIMPRYVYDPLRRMLKADSATQAGTGRGS